jgi:hypothetical protein
MTNNRVGSGRLSGILLIAVALLSAHPCLVFSQDLESRSPFPLRSQDDSSSAPEQADKHMHSREVEDNEKSAGVVPTLVCAMTTITAHSNSAPTTTSDALTPYASNALAPVARQEGNATACASGIWLMTWTNEKGDTRHATLHIQQEGEALSGTAHLPGGPMTGTFRLSGNVRGNRIVLSVKAYWHHVSFTGTVDGIKMSGSTQDGRLWLATKP